MPTKPIPFVNAQQSGFEALSGASPSAMNVVTDARGVMRVRPGIVAYDEAPVTAVDSKGIDGLRATAGGKLYAVGGRDPLERYIYCVSGGAALKLGEGVAGKGLYGPKRPTFAETEMLLVMSSGGPAQKVVLTDNESSRLAGGPPEATHVVANASRLFMDGGDDYPARVHWSDVATGTLLYDGHEVWSYGVGTAGFATMEARPDPVVAVHDSLNELWVWGSQTVQRWVPDASTIIAPVGSLDHGCIAPYSIVAVDGQFAWMDDRRRFVISDGSSATSISDEIQAQLSALLFPEECYGYRVITGVADLLVWSFPTDGRTFVYQKGIGWGQWHGRARSTWRAFGVSAHHLRRDANVNVVGTPDGLIAQLRDDAGTDLGNLIVADVTTGFLDRDTDDRKWCRGIRVVMRRDTIATGEIHVTYRDAPGAPWEPEMSIALGSEIEPVVEFPALGVYRYRQWKFKFSGGGGLRLVAVNERYEVQED